MAEIVTYDTAPAVVLSHQAQAALASAKDIVIDSDEMFQIAGEELRNIKALAKSVEEKRTAIVGPLNQAVKAVNALFKAPAEYLEQAESSVKRSMLVWNQEQQRKAEIARRAAEAAAAEERRRAEAVAAEQRRIAEEAERKALEAAQAAEAAAAAGDVDAAMAANDVVSQHVAAAEAAQAAVASAEVVTYKPAVAAPAKVAGTAFRTTYTAQLDDLMELVKAVAAGQAPIQCLAADMSFLKAQARAFKKTGPLFPGVTAVAEHGISARAA